MPYLKKYFLCTLCALSFALTGCFTGIEGTQKITAKDVEKSANRQAAKATSQLSSIALDSFPNWRIEKKFFVTDNNALLMFLPSMKYSVDTLNLEGKILTYKGYTAESILDNDPKVNILLSDGTNTYIYPTGKDINAIRLQKSVFSIPFLIDMDMISDYDNLLKGRYLYIRTAMWYDETGKMIAGQKFIRVKISRVVPGNKIYPLKVIFITSESTTACVFMASEQSPIQNRSFDNLFSVSDIRESYPSISDSNWNLIVKGQIAHDMTKEECRLSIGTPQNIEQRPSYEGLKEYWFYSDGTYLIFTDGILKSFRK